MRGGVSEPQPREPVGLSGGGLPGAVSALLQAQRDNDRTRQSFQGFFRLIDWAKGIGVGPAGRILLSPSVAASRLIIRFVDRFMAEDRKVLTAADASEGALYVLFAAVLALDERAPGLLALDNADHGLNPRLARRLVKQVCDSNASPARSRGKYS